MGVDFDFSQYLRKNKLSSSLFQEPVNQLDDVTQSLEQPNLDFLFRTIRLIERNFRPQRNNDQNQQILLYITIMQGGQIFVMLRNSSINQPRNLEIPHQAPLLRQLSNEQIPVAEEEIENRIEMVRQQPAQQFQQSMIDIQFLRENEEEQEGLESASQILMEHPQQKGQIEMSNDQNLNNPKCILSNNKIERDMPREDIIQKTVNNKISSENTISNSIKSKEHYHNQTFGCLNQLPENIPSHEILPEKQPEPDLNCFQQFVRAISNFFRRFL